MHYQAICLWHFQTLIFCYLFSRLLLKCIAYQIKTAIKVNYPLQNTSTLLIFSVCDVLPLVLQKVKKPELPAAQIYRWLQMSVEFYIMFVTQSPSFNTSSSNSPGNIMLNAEATFKKKFEFSWWTDKKVQYSRYVKNYLSILLLVFFKIHFIKTYFQFNFWMTVKHSYFFTYWSKD